MQRDLKIGLSLALLVLGVVGALLFRREEPKTARVPSLKSGKKLDEVIAERSRTPYMTGDVEFDEDSIPGDHSTAQRAAKPENLTKPEWLTQEDNDKDPFEVKAQTSASHTAIPAERKVSAYRPIPVAPTSTSATGRAEHHSSRTHTIGPGDTLSSIAHKYLGTPNRYQEIYEANRAVLKNPDRLPLGETLTIPGSESIRTTSAHPTVGTHSVPNPIEVLDPLSASHHPSTTPPKVIETPPAAKIVGVTVPPAGALALEDEDFLEPVGPVTPSKTNSTSPPKPVEITEIVAIPPATDTTTKPTTSPKENVARPQGDKKFVPVAKQPFIQGRRPLGKTESTKPVSETSTITSYVVRKGDTLQKISEKLYGTSRRANALFEANKKILGNPNALREGMTLSLPENL